MVRHGTLKHCIWYFKMETFVGYLHFIFVTENILKAIKNATGTSVIFPINISLIHFFFVVTSVPNVGERFAKA